MKKKKICFILSLILAAVFPIKTVIDYTDYQNSFNSAPFYVWIWPNILYFLVPATIAFIVGSILKKSRAC